MITVTPTILERTQKNFEARFQALRPHFLRAQIDVLNDTFVSGISFADPGVVDSFKTNLVFEIDLMVSMEGYDLMQWNKPWVEMIAFHIEATNSPKKYIDMIRSWGKRVFISMNSETHIEALDPVINLVDGVLVMTVVPGKSGNPFIYESLDIIRALRARHKTLPIEADGGVTKDTLPMLLEAGVTEVAVGSYLQNDRVEERSLDFLEIIEKFEAEHREGI